MARYGDRSLAGSCLAHFSDARWHFRKVLGILRRWGRRNDETIGAGGSGQHGMTVAETTLSRRVSHWYTDLIAHVGVGEPL